MKQSIEVLMMVAGLILIGGAAGCPYPSWQLVSACTGIVLVFASCKTTHSDGVKIGDEA